MALFKNKESFAVPDGLDTDELLHRAETDEDPARRYAYLKKAEEAEPDNLAVQRSLLMLGRLHERNPKVIDFSVIKCYLFHAFEHPEKHTEKEIQSMSRDLLDNERLKRCLSLAADAEAFRLSYLEELAREYVRLFLVSDSGHVPSIFGFSFKSNIAKHLAPHAQTILTNILSCPHYGAEEQRLVARQFYKAFSMEMNSQTLELDKLLGAGICRALK